MNDLLADFTLSAALSVSGTLSLRTDSVTAAYGSATLSTGADVVDMGAMTDLGKSASDPVLVCELSAAEATTGIKYQVLLHHMDASATAATTLNVLAASGIVDKPGKGIMIEMPIPRKHRRYLKASILTRAASAITPSNAGTAKLYIRNGGVGDYASMSTPD